MFKKTCSLDRGEKLDFWVCKNKLKNSKSSEAVTGIARVRL